MEKETDTDKILRAIAAVHSRVDEVVDKMDAGFTEVNRRFDKVIEPRLDEHVRRIKKLDEEVFPN